VKGLLDHPCAGPPRRGDRRAQRGVDTFIRARGVRATYRTHVPLAAQRGLAALGLDDFDDLHRLCLHESNPNMVAAVAAELGASSQTVRSISATAGTLAGVSVFALLDEALRSHRETPGSRDAIVCALIGDVGGSVAAGHVSLRYHRLKSSAAQDSPGEMAH
jgi:3-oxoacyl-[acyl-carrier-protein] synthase III